MLAVLLELVDAAADEVSAVVLLADADCEVDTELDDD